MATSNKCALSPLLVFFAVVVIALNLQPSAATRAIQGEGAAKDAVADAVHQVTAAAEQPPTTGGAQPQECRPLLLGMTPCAGFLSNRRMYAPDRACCAGFNAMFQYDTIICMCHVVNGDIDQLLPGPVQHARMVRLFAACGHHLPEDRFAGMCRATIVPPIDAPIPLPSPPSSPEPSTPSQP